MPEYEPVARSKRAGEDALRERLPQLDAAGIDFVVVSGDMIEGTITATLLERAQPGCDRRPPRRGRPAVHASASSPPRSPTPPSTRFPPSTPATSAM